MIDNKYIRRNYI